MECEVVGSNPPPTPTPTPDPTPDPNPNPNPNPKPNPNCSSEDATLKELICDLRGVMDGIESYFQAC